MSRASDILAAVAALAMSSVDRQMELAKGYHPSPQFRGPTSPSRSRVPYSRISAKEHARRARAGCVGGAIERKVESRAFATCHGSAVVAKQYRHGREYTPKGR